ncbi:MAG: glycosyltransferase family 2 protein [Gammaproteobacteria bacterium]|nr:glycosyltransferase family 2 protein [Gammaproteobacteria bacterium]
MEFVFWFSTFFVLYTYFGYPVLIWLIGLSKTKGVSVPEPAAWPSVAVIVPVHNEIKYVERKIENLKELDYPKGSLTICFASDGSDDGTNELIGQHRDVQLVAYHQRRGKPSAINEAAARQTAEILVFTDARQLVDRRAVRKLVVTLLQQGVGAVSGELVQHDTDSITGKSVGMYWGYEKWIRKSESKVHSVAGVTGALYAIRREDFAQIPEDTLLDDFEIPIRVLRKGNRVLIEPGAYVYDSVQEDASSERKRKIRTLAGNFQSFVRNKWLFLPGSNPIWWQFISHKVFRLAVPYALIAAFITSYLLADWFFNLVFILQCLFYSVALLAHFSPRVKTFRSVSIVHVFCELNLAAFLALFSYLTKSIDIKWEKTA